MKTVLAKIFLLLFCLAALALPLQAEEYDSKSAIKALNSDIHGPGEEAGKEITTQAIGSGVDPLSLITVVPGGPPVRIPIAVPDIVKLGDNEDTENLGKLFTDVVRNDLAMSGLFEVLPTETFVIVNMQKEGMTASTIQFDSWYNVGASALIKSAYSMDMPNVSFQLSLFNVDTAAKIPLNFQDPNIAPSRVRAMAHDFVNAIIEYYTGERGVFGTRILYTVTASKNMRIVQSFETDG